MCCGPVLFRSLGLKEDEDVPKGSFQDPDGSFDRVLSCLIAICNAACFLASTAIFRSSSDLPEQVAGGPAAAAAVGSTAATASTPAARSIHC
jgi:hypothetical protein